MPPDSPAPCFDPWPCDSDPLQVFAALAHWPGVAFLYSGDAATGWDILTAEPVRTLTVTGSRINVNGRPDAGRHSPFALMNDWLGAPLPVSAERWPFAGGLIGLVGYEAGYALEGLAPDDAPGPLPDIALGDYRWALLHERASGHWWLCHDPAEPGQKNLAARLQRQLKTPAPLAPHRLTAPFTPQMSRTDYAGCFARIQAYLQAGDCYQVNLAQRWDSACHGDPADAFIRLARAHSAPYSAFVHPTPDSAVISLSPECLLHRCPDGRLETRPIKGTRARGATPTEDAAACQALRTSAKDRAENLMIVDLLRNDLGRICLPGSIRADALFAVESHPNVHHLVSTVSGQPRPGVSQPDALAACFPGGSITGAPKRRAMEIIRELEPSPRSAYCGAIGYFSRHERMAWNVAIRTLVQARDQLHCWGGGGIVADSEAEQEYAESRVKVQTFLDTLSATLDR